MRHLRTALGHGEKGFTLVEVLVVVFLLGLLAAIVIPNVSQFIGKGEEEARQAEHHNIQTAVLALMADANVNALEESYLDCQEKTDLEEVKAIVGGTEYTLDKYLIGGQYPLLQSYDIRKDGLVTVLSE